MSDCASDREEGQEFVRFAGFLLFGVGSLVLLALGGIAYGLGRWLL